MHRLVWRAALAILAGVTPAATQRPLFLWRGHPAAAPSAPGLEATLATLLGGPDAAQRAAGFTSAIPAGTRLVGLEVRAGRVRLTLSDAFLAALAPDGELELAIEQLAKSVLDAPGLHSLELAVQTSAGVRSLDQLLAVRRTPPPPPPAPPPPAPPPPAPPPPTPPLPANPVPGALAGRTIAVSPGHGWYWHSTLGWTTQRPTLGGLTEDFHTNEIAMRYLIPALENLGATVVSVRERGETTLERVADNDQGPPTYTEVGSWFLSLSTGYLGGTYRYANTTSSMAPANAVATWNVSITRAGRYPVYVFYRAGSNRAPDARYTIHHTGGATEVTVDQTRHDLRWLHLGDFWFGQAAGARITLDNRSATLGRVVISDAVRVGDGTGSIARGGGTSGKPRWQEACRYWAQFAGAPASVYDIAGCSDSCDDVTARPKYAEWRGADAYLSLHTNAGGGSGTSSFIHNTAPTAGSAALQAATHDQVIQDIRRYYDPSWVDRGKQAANFGEVRELRTMPGVLLELAFHDQPGSKDHDALHDPEFRFIGGRAYARGVLRYFAPSAPLPPDPPAQTWVTQDGARGLAVAWSAAAGATGYAIEASQDGKGFAEVGQTSALSWSTGVLPHGTTRSFRVRAFNASGRSFPSEVLTAGTSHTQRAGLLLVQGFDRLGEFVKGPENTKDYLRLHGDAIRRGASFSLGFDAASNEAVLAGRVQLGAYRAVDWLCGEESTVDETFSAAEQALVRAYVAAGGRLLVTGAEVGWDLEARGSAADRAFYNQVLGARYVRDDAATYAFQPGTGSLSGVPAGSFDDGSQGTYDVDWPDVIAPADGKSTVALRYANSASEVAGIERVDGAARVVHLGFPLETVVDPDARAALMQRALRFLLTPRALEAPPSVAAGSVAALRLELPAEPNAGYVLAAALGLGALPLPPALVVPLAADPVFALSLSAGAPTFAGFQGSLDAAGRAQAAFQPPALAALRGVDFYISGITLSSLAAPRTVLPWVRVAVQ